MLKRYASSNPTTSTRILAGCAAVGVIISTLLFASDEFVNVYAGLLWMLGGGVCLLIALSLYDVIPRFEIDVSRSLTPEKTAFHFLIPGIVILFVLAEINGNGLGGDFYVSRHLQLVMLVAGIALVVMGLGGGQMRIEIDRREVFIVGLITAFALLVRVWRLGDAFRLFLDEVSFVVANNQFRADHHIYLLRPYSSITAFPWIYPYWQSEAIAVFGRNLVGLRITSAMVGTLGVPALYFLAKQLFDRHTAILAALILASFPVHVHYSRLSYNNIADPLFGTLAFAFLARGLRTQNRIDYALAGAMLGLTQYFYEGGRLLFPILAVIFIGCVILFWRVPNRMRGLMIFITAAVIVAAPIYYTLRAIDAPVVRRLNLTGLDLNVEFWQNLKDKGKLETGLRHHMEQSFLTYVHRSEMELFYQPYGENDFIFYRTPATFYYGGNEPLVPRLLVPFFMLGVFVALSRWRVGGILLAWIVLAALGNFLIQVNAVSARYVLTFPALALLVALGLRFPLALVWRYPAQILLIVGVFICAWQVWYYFVPQLDYLNRTIHNFDYLRFDPDDAVLRAVDFPSGTYVHLVTSAPLDPDNVRDITAFLRDDLRVDVRKPEEVTAEYLRDLPRDVDNAFFIEPEDEQTLSLLREYFTLDPPQFSPSDDLPVRNALVLYYADAE